MSGYTCADCGQHFDGRPYYSGGEDGEYPLCARDAGPFLCPDFEDDATPDHAAVCMSAGRDPWAGGELHARLRRAMGRIGQ